MSSYHNNLALHISTATLKGRRRLSAQTRGSWSYVACGLLGASAIWAVALALV